MKKNRGFSIIELVLLSTIISFIFVAICSLQIRGAEISKNVKNKEEAFYIARSIGEIYKSLDLKINNEYIYYVNNAYEAGYKLINMGSDCLGNDCKKYKVIIKKLIVIH